MSSLRTVIAERAAQRGLHVNLERMRYSNHVFFDGIPKKNRSNALFVGVGHGQDALLALLDDQLERVVGVDPFADAEGGRSAFYEQLMSLVAEYQLEDRFIVEKAPIQDFLAGNAGRFDLIVAKDVLHHIWETETTLSRSNHFLEAVKLFDALAAVSCPGGILAISDVQRHGLRPFLSNLGLLKSVVNYRTKQSWKEWNKAITNSQWVLRKVQNYVPYPFRSQSWFWASPWGRYTLCDRYNLVYERKG